jgi:C4-dicarboxylate transporter DctQ subunit
MQTPAVHPLCERCESVLRWATGALAAVAGLAIAAMIAVTCVDVVGRWFGRPLTGTYDIVELLGAIAVAGAIPYTTAWKGHVAVDFLVRKLPGRLGRAVDVLLHLITIPMFALLTWGFVQYGIDLKASGQVTLTLRWPIFWMSYWMALCSAVMLLVLVFELVRPGKELMKP